jgi:alkanesulfonate monooxygenase SsuD/methylene tetrahydromethanopterin reductase-like flavin-dependent oxidoreductase (luciferase family)
VPALRALEFGLVLQTDPPASEVIRRAKEAEAAGFAAVWTFDSVVLWQEPFVIYSRILAETTRLKVGPMVTNPRTRDWSVTASLFATLNDMYGHRTICGIGRGDSAVRVVGGRPANLVTLEESIIAIRALAAGEQWRPRPASEAGLVAAGRGAGTVPGPDPAGSDADQAGIRIPWATPPAPRIWVAAYGPKALAVAGRVGDGLILQLADPFLVEWSVRAFRQAAVDAGRDPDLLDVCVAAPAYVGADLAHQREQTRWFGGMVGNHVADLVARYGNQGDVPQALTEYIARRAGYDYRHHGRAGNPDAAFVPDDVVDRFCLLGPAETHVSRLGELHRLGVTHFALYLMHDAMDATLAAYGADVIPAVLAGL